MKLPDLSHRQWLPDQLRGWAVIWMVLVHTFEVFVKQSDWSHPISQAAFFLGAVPAAPVFMFLMGYYSQPATRNSQPTTLSYLLNRPSRLLLWGLLLNLGLNANLLVHYLTGALDVQPLKYILGVDIFFLAGLSLLLIRLIGLAKPHWAIWILSALVVSFFGNRIHWSGNGSHWSDFALAFIGGAYDWSYFPLFPWAAYPLAGAGFRLLIRKHTHLIQMARYRFYALLISVPVALAGVASAWKVSVHLPVYYHHGILFFLWAVSFILIISSVIFRLYPSRSKTGFSWIGFLGMRVTSFYVIQWLIIGNLGTFFYQSLGVHTALALFALMLFVSGILTYFYYHYKFTK